MPRMMRIDPTLSLSWRTPTSIQIGFPRAVVTTEVTAVEEHLLVALRSGVNETALAGLAATLNVSRSFCDAFIDRVRPAVVDEAAPRLRVGIDGTGVTAEWIARVLRERCDVRAVNAASVDHERLAPDRRIPTARRSKQESETKPWRPDLVVIVGEFAISPARSGVWLRREIPHLAVVVGDRDARVGPLVRAGSGPCLVCVELSSVDADPARVAMLSQLAGKPSGGATDLVSCEIAARVARIVDGVTGNRHIPPGEYFDMDSATGQWTSGLASHCSRCSCQALRENATAVAA
jgi:hypothetical protein